jgi:c-di-GMP-binding flagellar brake protein YcgR
MSLQQKRFSVRKKTHFPVSVSRIVRGQQTYKIAPGQSFMTVDLSSGGLGIVTDVMILVGDLLSLEFRLPGEDQLMKVLGRVTSTIEVNPPRPGARVRAGLKFENLSEADARTLANYMGNTAGFY